MRNAATFAVTVIIGVTFLMHGGPATIHGPRAYDAFCEFAPADEPTATTA